TRIRISAGSALWMARMLPIACSEAKEGPSSTIRSCPPSIAVRAPSRDRSTGRRPSKRRLASSMKASSSSTTSRLCSLSDMPLSAPEDIVHEVSLEQIIDGDAGGVDLDEVLGYEGQPHRSVLESVDELLGLLGVDLEREDGGRDLRGAITLAAFSSRLG